MKRARQPQENKSKLKSVITQQKQQPPQQQQITSNKNHNNKDKDKDNKNNSLNDKSSQQKVKQSHQKEENHKEEDLDSVEENDDVTTEDSLQSDLEEEEEEEEEDNEEDNEEEEEEDEEEEEEEDEETDESEKDEEDSDSDYDLFSFMKLAENEKSKKNNKPKMEVNNSTQPTFNNTQPKPTTEDDSDSDWEQYRTINRVGNVPMHWYDGYEHIGYTIDGEKLVRPEQKDQLERFLSSADPSGLHWRTIWDEKHAREVVITNDEYKLLKRLQKGKLPDSNAEPFEAPIDLPYPDGIHPLSNAPEPKSRFVPSKWEAQRIAKLVKAIRKGWISLDNEKERETAASHFYLLWDEQTDSASKLRDPMQRIPPPKMKLPTNEASYNPPTEYLWSKEEKEKWRAADPEDRPPFEPQKHDRLRHVGLYKKALHDQYSRCLDLYLCARTAAPPLRAPGGMKSLLPKLPKPSQLRPFPTTLCITYKGHTKAVRCISPSPTGQWLVSAGKDKSVRLWEVSTGRCIKTWTLPNSAHSISWNPNPSIPLIAVATQKLVILIDPQVSNEETQQTLKSLFDSIKPIKEDKTGTEWVLPSKEDQEDGIFLRIIHSKDVSQVVWHHKGDYFSTVQPGSGNKSVLIHRLSQMQTQTPFKKGKGDVQAVCFHPTKPFFLVATQRYIKIYNLVKQSLWKKLLPGVNEISSIDVHPGGDNVIASSFDTKICWFDLDWSVKPYRVLRYHKHSVQRVVYHQKYPLFASCSHDGSIHIFHGMVYNDLLQNPMIVPVNVLKGHQIVDGNGVLDCVFHPSQPWIFSCGADGDIHLYSS